MYRATAATANLQLAFIDVVVADRRSRSWWRAISGGAFLLKRFCATSMSPSESTGILPARYVWAATISSHPQVKVERREVAG